MMMMMMMVVVVVVFRTRLLACRPCFSGASIASVAHFMFQKCPMTATARAHKYNQKTNQTNQTKTWATMDRACATNIIKCAMRVDGP
jgi:hypothetical protein